MKQIKLYTSHLQEVVGEVCQSFGQERLEYRDQLKITEAATAPITKAAFETQQCSGVCA